MWRLGTIAHFHKSFARISSLRASLRVMSRHHLSGNQIKFSIESLQQSKWRVTKPAEASSSHYWKESLAKALATEQSDMQRTAENAPLDHSPDKYTIDRGRGRYNCKEKADQHHQEASLGDQLLNTPCWISSWSAHRCKCVSSLPSNEQQIQDCLAVHQIARLTVLHKASTRKPTLS